MYNTRFRDHKIMGKLFLLATLLVWRIIACHLVLDPEKRVVATAAVVMSNPSRSMQVAESQDSVPTTTSAIRSTEQQVGYWQSLKSFWALQTEAKKIQILLFVVYTVGLLLFLYKIWRKSCQEYDINQRAYEEDRAYFREAGQSVTRKFSEFHGNQG